MGYANFTQTFLLLLEDINGDLARGGAACMMPRS